MTIKLLEISEEALKQYREQVKDNKFTTLEQAQRKLTRNYILVRDHAPERITRRWFSSTYSYGNLDITVRFGKIIKVANRKGKQDGWNPPKQEYIKLCKQLGIEDNKFAVKFNKKVVYK